MPQGNRCRRYRRRPVQGYIWTFTEHPHQAHVNGQHRNGRTHCSLHVSIYDRTIWSTLSEGFHVVLFQIDNKQNNRRNDYANELSTSSPPSSSPRPQPIYRQKDSKEALHQVGYAINNRTDSSRDYRICCLSYNNCRIALLFTAQGYKVQCRNCIFCHHKLSA